MGELHWLERASARSRRTHVAACSSPRVKASQGSNGSLHLLASCPQTVGRVVKTPLYSRLLPAPAVDQRRRRRAARQRPAGGIGDARRPVDVENGTWTFRFERPSSRPSSSSLVVDAPPRAHGGRTEFKIGGRSSMGLRGHPCPALPCPALVSTPAIARTMRPAARLPPPGRANPCSQRGDGRRAGAARLADAPCAWPWPVVGREGGRGTAEGQRVICKPRIRLSHPLRRIGRYQTRIPGCRVCQIEVSPDPTTPSFLPSFRPSSHAPAV